MKKTINLCVGLLLVSIGFSQGTSGDIQGQLFENPDTDSPAMFAKVWVERGTSRFGDDTDEDGRFMIHNVPSGMYVLKVSYAGDTLSHTVLANVEVDGIAHLGRINFYDKVTEYGEVIFYGNTDPLIKHDFGQSRITTLDIAKSPAKNDVKGLIMSRNSDIRVNESGQMMIRGGRPNDLISYIDGVKMDKVQNIPSSAIGSVTVYTSAIPAKYGDTSGGVIIIETKSYYDLWRAWKIMQSR